MKCVFICGPKKQTNKITQILHESMFLLQHAWACIKSRQQMVEALGLYKSISSGAQYVTLPKYFSHPSLVMYSFATPPIKLKLGQQIGGGLLIVNRLDHFPARNWHVLSVLHPILPGRITYQAPLEML
jgi:hypothetical protein